uniref:Uncharacterized protein n=1 Tax=Salix viminalis TaxID=40686 RepID=A0A6N2KSV0_SALVM
MQDLSVQSTVPHVIDVLNKKQMGILCISCSRSFSNVDNWCSDSHKSSDRSICSLFTGSMGKPCWLSSYRCYIISDDGLLPLLWRGSINCCTSFSDISQYNNQ